ncbi:hypothetical protein E1J02_16975 [Phocaeicola dorei]|nr:hypothetical protein E1J02_16975 [Phocaeicola dorei]
MTYCRIEINKSARQYFSKEIAHLQLKNVNNSTSPLSTDRKWKMICSLEHGKVCFELLKTVRVTPESVFAGTQQGIFSAAQKDLSRLKNTAVRANNLASVVGRLNY